MLSGISIGLAVLLVAGVVALLGWLVGGGAKHDEGQTIMRFGPRFRGLAILSVLAGVFIVAVFAVRLLLGLDRPDIFIIPVGLAAFFEILATPLLLMGFRTEVKLNDAGITFRKTFGGSIRIPWESVEAVTFSSRAGGFCVEGAGLRMKISSILHGREAFIEECKKRLPPNLYGNALDGPFPPLIL